MKNITKKIFTILAAQFVTAIAFTVLLTQNKLSPTGFGGFAVTLNYLTGLSTQLWMVILAVPVVIWALCKKNYVKLFYAAVSYFSFTAFTALVPYIIPAVKMAALPASIISAVIMGIACSFIFVLDVPNGPESLAGLEIQTRKGLPIGAFFFILNTAVILTSFVYADYKTVICSFIGNAVCSAVTDASVAFLRKNIKPKSSKKTVTA